MVFAVFLDFSDKIAKNGTFWGFFSFLNPQIVMNYLGNHSPVFLGSQGFQNGITCRGSIGENENVLMTPHSDAL